MRSPTRPLQFMAPMKTCSKCGETKNVSEFHRDKRKECGFRPQCKACARAYYQANKEKFAEQQRAYREANREKVAQRHRAYNEANKEKVSEYGRAYRRANRKRIAEKRRAYYQANKEKILERHLARYEAKKEEILERQRDYKKRRYSEDRAYVVVDRLRRRLRSALNGQAKPATTMELVGCSSEKLCAWLEMHFDEGMTWENRSEWHIDHIKPIASFEDPADPACWHWSNLQPLWAEDNLKKGDRC